MNFMQRFAVWMAVLAVCFLTGCAGVNKGLDSANEGAYEAGKPVGKVMKMPSSVMEGAAEGSSKKEHQDNPLNR